MNILALLNPGRWMLYAAAIASAVAGYFAWQTHERGVAAAPYIAAIKKQNIEAAATLKRLTEQVQAKEKALQDFTNERNENDATNEGALSVLADKLHAAGRLRDHNATGCSGPASGTQVAASSGAGGKDDSSAGWLLSVEASDFLRGQARLADEINAAYISCRADAFKVRE